MAPATRLALNTYGRVAVLVVAVAAGACGGAAMGQRSTSASAPAGASAAVSPSASAGATASTSSAAPQPTVPATPTTVATGSAPAAAPSTVPLPRATSLADKLAALQLDPQDLPSFDDLTPTQLRGVMPLFALALHVKCTDCHDADFSAPTRRKKIAVHMWNDLARPFTAVSGGAGPGPVFCDSCHQQQLKPLVRGDSAALKAGMAASFVAGLKSKDDAAAMACTSCHVSETDFALLDKWSR